MRTRDAQTSLRSQFSIVPLFLGILAIVVAAWVVWRIEDQKESEIMHTNAWLNQIALRVHVYALEFDVYPAKEEGLRALIRLRKTEFGLNDTIEALTIDIWGTPFDYSLRSEGYRITSAGPDTVLGTRDDISITEWRR